MHVIRDARGEIREKLNVTTTAIDYLNSRFAFHDAND